MLPRVPRKGRQPRTSGRAPRASLSARNAERSTKGRVSEVQTTKGLAGRVSAALPLLRFGGADTCFDRAGFSPIH